MKSATFELNEDGALIRDICVFSFIVAEKIREQGKPWAFDLQESSARGIVCFLFALLRDLKRSWCYRSLDIEVLMPDDLPLPEFLVALSHPILTVVVGLCLNTMNN